MLVQIFLGSAMIVVTTVIQAIFMIAGVKILGRHLTPAVTKSVIRSTLTLAGFVLWLFLATVFEVWAWALLYLLLGAANSVEEAAYFSTVTFTTVGFGDITLDKTWRLLSSFEGANGLLMFGWSTALVFAAVQWVFGREHKGSRHR